MSYRGGPSRGGPGGMQKSRGGGGGMNFPNDMSSQQFGYQQRGFAPQPGQPQLQQQQAQQMNMPPQPIQIPQLQQGSRSFMSGMPSPSLVQSGSLPLMGYQGAPPNTSATRTPFGPPIGPIDQGQKSHHDILRKHQEEYALKQTGQVAMSQAHSSTPGTYIAMSSKHNNSVIPVLPRLANPYDKQNLGNEKSSGLIAEQLDKLTIITVAVGSSEIPGASTWGVDTCLGISFENVVSSEQENIA
ncbi:hypothetical protein EDD21DRAFT_415075 [Dissophora ornata]|nr:hypothetical protein EDD21DRAFT_415075 [Dissophora ornata]